MVIDADDPPTILREGKMIDGTGVGLVPPDLPTRDIQDADSASLLRPRECPSARRPSKRLRRGIEFDHGIDPTGHCIHDSDPGGRGDGPHRATGRRTGQTQRSDEAWLACRV